ncbi:hypothetical protein Pint_10871 [Pistacia integerrima]|uniref:Uncharacterized protein n=1 Tax=Pistacia integerrima TaxID=434235 RepID=A0ACC0XLT9_9ROSI|nr:hypothetical protein Pint_10871 [Pistacia integerrima]
MCETKNFYLWLLQIVSLLGLLVLCLWLGLRPQNPTVTVVEISVPPIDNSSSPAADGKQNGSLAYNLEIKNPNKDSIIWFDVISLTFFHGQDTAATDRISSFKLRKDATQYRENHLDVDGRVWKALRNALSNATAELKVEFLTGIRFKTIGIKSKHHKNHKLEGKVKLGKDGKISGKKKKIKLKHSSKKWRIKLGSHFN